ncbi:protein mono-ADP-ribosyltransferase PARP12-like [Genypterus blacodes]|uniref:protein mono-ADP-ribosyltransferase PARP12-like n=1 Tax=Genypterus blacodes TaxID=154954 RepID=UPI003F77671A
MSSVISSFIVRTLCENQGCLDFQQLDALIRQRVTVAEPILNSVLLDDGKIAIQGGKQKASGGHGISPDSLVVAKSSLRICQSEAGQCTQCDGLHVCRYYVCGDCRFGDKCKHIHSLASTDNATLLKRRNLHEMTEKQLFQLLLQNDPYLLPEVCPHYNKGIGEHGSCKFSTSCTKLHLCLHFVQGDCKFGSKCKRTHNFDERAMAILKGRGLSQANLQNIQKIYRNKFIITGQEERRYSPAVVLPVERGAVCEPTKSSTKPSTSSAGATKGTSEADRKEICLFFIRRHCSFKEKCVRVHCHLPYKWQVLKRDGVTWKDLPNNEDIEQAYCDPGEDMSCANQPASISAIRTMLSLLSTTAPPVQPTAVDPVDFLKMTCRGSEVRRLSTASSVSKPPHFMLTTKWLWYWKDDSGIWVEYGKQGGTDSSPSISSPTLENVYLADRETQIPFTAGKQQYILFFIGKAGQQQMYQQNVKYNTKREVRRRPRFVSSHDVEVELKSTSADSSSSSPAANVPSYWDKTALPDFGYKLVPLSQTVKTYTMIEKLFKQTMPHSTINNIQRIQNPSLWKVFQWQKEQMAEKNGGKPVNQQYLFHGTDESLIEAICEQNFDWRVCGAHGTSYGKGSYFARDASYSNRYAKARLTRSKVMFVAMVLVGEHTRGSSSFVRPPAKRTSKSFYDSCVDSESNPSIFVIFEKQQIYPEYLIDYM